MEEHGVDIRMNPEDTFRFQLVGRYRDLLTRQLPEAATIKRAIIGHHIKPTERNNVISEIKVPKRET